MKKQAQQDKMPAPKPRNPELVSGRTALAPQVHSLMKTLRGFLIVPSWLYSTTQLHVSSHLIVTTANKQNRQVFITAVQNTFLSSVPRDRIMGPAIGQEDLQASTRNFWYLWTSHQSFRKEDSEIPGSSHLLVVSSTAKQMFPGQPLSLPTLFS